MQVEFVSFCPTSVVETCILGLYIAVDCHDNGINRQLLENISRSDINKNPLSYISINYNIRAKKKKALETWVKMKIS